MNLRTVCLIAGGMGANNYRLQPWRYLTEVAGQLAAVGHPVTVLTDGLAPHGESQLAQVSLRCLPSVRNPAWKPNQALAEALHQVAPQAIIWHMGLTSFYYQDFTDLYAAPVVGLFSSPIYRLLDLIRLGPAKLARGYYISGVHLAGSLAPACLLRRRVRSSRLSAMVVQTGTTQRELIRAGAGDQPIFVVPPGVDKAWRQYDGAGNSAVRHAWGFGGQELVVLFYGSPAELRGLPTLVQAFALAHACLPRLRLVILSRRGPRDWMAEQHRIANFVQQHRLNGDVKIIDGFLEPLDLVHQVAAADVVALPFELLPADAPLSILEAQALGKPVVTTRVACLPELAAQGSGFLAQPANPASLAEAILQAAAVAQSGRLAAGPVQSNPCRRYSRSWAEVGEAWSSILQNL